MTKSEADEAKYSAVPTMSSAEEGRLIAPRSTPYFCAFSIKERLASVKVKPGAMALTLILKSPTSLANERAKPMTPP